MGYIGLHEAQWCSKPAARPSRDLENAEASVQVRNGLQHEATAQQAAMSSAMLRQAVQEDLLQTSSCDKAAGTQHTKKGNWQSSAVLAGTSNLTSEGDLPSFGSSEKAPVP